MRLPAVAALLVLGACSDDPQPAAPVQQPARAPAPESAWVLQAHFPGPTRHDVAPIQTPAGVLERHTERFEDEDGAFVLQWADYPQAYVTKLSRDSIYDHAGLGAAAAVGGKVTRSSPLELSGFVGREVFVDDGRGGAYRSQFFLVDRRLHLAGVATSPARLAEPIVRDFFGSLRLVQTPR